jgi:hypothetical protein
MTTWMVLETYKDTEIAALAQLVEQRTENPCVRSSILRGGIFVYRIEDKTNQSKPNFSPFSSYEDVIRA